MEMLQKEDGWCGPAVLSYAFHRYGKEVSQEELVEEMHVTKGKGTETRMMEAGVKKHGFTPYQLPDDKKEKTLELIKFLSSTGVPVIIDYLDGKTLEDGHYAVIEKVSGDDIGIFNPSSGKETITKDWLFKHWKDVTSSGKIFKNWAMAVMKKGGE